MLCSLDVTALLRDWASSLYFACVLSIPPHPCSASSHCLLTSSQTISSRLVCTFPSHSLWTAPFFASFSQDNQQARFGATVFFFSRRPVIHVPIIPSAQGPSGRERGGVWTQKTGSQASLWSFSALIFTALLPDLCLFLLLPSPRSPVNLSSLHWRFCSDSFPCELRHPISRDAKSLPFSCHPPSSLTTHVH